MKIAITGHSAGIGQAFAKYLSSRSHDIVGLSKRDGHNIRIIPRIVDKILACDMWINNAQSGYAHLGNLGFHPNSFIIGALLQPDYLNIRHLPEHVLESIEQVLKIRLEAQPGYLLEDSYNNILHYIKQPAVRNLSASIEKLKIMDLRRACDSSKIFTDLYQLI